MDFVIELCVLFVTEMIGWHFKASGLAIAFNLSVRVYGCQKLQMTAA